VYGHVSYRDLREVGRTDVTVAMVHKGRGQRGRADKSLWGYRRAPVGRAARKVSVAFSEIALVRTGEKDRS
jgi:hypothetical protein